VMLTLLLFILPATWAQLSQFFYELPRMASKGQALLMLLPEQYPDLITTVQVQEWVHQAREELASMGQWALSFSLSGITVLMAMLIYCVLVPILVFFLLKDGDDILSWCLNFLPRQRALLNEVW
ncbi:AI-2E family transporter, partial [Wenyingzhuangia sp. 1_MG-2023]|nr:AI-2E family transporter [Wenyingzhuangia sp. 1_MG-2023]